MIKWEIRVLLRHLLDQGLSKAAIARQVGVNRLTIHRWLLDGQLDRAVETRQVPRPVRRTRPTKFDRFKAIIQARLERYPDLTGVRLFEELTAAGYCGGISQLRDYVAQVRPRPAPEPVVRVETEPGHQAQVDFAEFDFPWGKRHALLLVLGYTRLLRLKFYPKQGMRTLFAGLGEAFASFGGVPRGHRTVDRQPRRQIRQRPRRDDHRALQDGGDPKAKAVVRATMSNSPPWKGSGALSITASRVRSGAYPRWSPRRSSNATTPQEGGGSGTQINWSPAKPGRFRGSLWKLST